MPKYYAMKHVMRTLKHKQSVVG